MTENQELIVLGLTNLLSALGAFDNDTKTKLEVVTKGNLDYVVFTNSKGEWRQSLNKYNPKETLEHLLKMLVSGCKEFQEIDPKLNACDKCDCNNECANCNNLYENCIKFEPIEQE